MERTRKPTSPGEIIKTHYLEPLNLSIAELAQFLGVSRSTLSAVINGCRSVNADMAIRLSQALSTTPELWLNLQSALDLWKARQDSGRWSTIKRLPQDAIKHFNAKDHAQKSCFWALLHSYTAQ